MEEASWGVELHEEKVIRVSVRNLVEFILRSGDIDNRTSGSMEREAMHMGGRLHRKIQRSMGSGYQAEVPLKMQVTCEGFTIQIEGRADGIIIQDTNDGYEVVIDEIKGVFRDLERIEEPVPVHLAQAKCYAWIYSKQKKLDIIGVQMTYCHLDTEEIKRFKKEYTAEELEHWFADLIGQYEKWARFQIEWEKKRNASVRQTEFPFPYRAGQKDVAAAVYRTILRKKKLFIQAPTGVGKTISTVFPAVKAVGEGLGDKIFYLTAKTIARTAAEQAFRTMQDRGLQMKVITLTAKEKICFCEEAVCNPDACPYAKGHFDRVNDAVYDMLMNENEISRPVIEAQAQKFRVCPFELSLDISTWTDAVVCDYNYVFDPNAHLKRFFSEGSSGDYIFLIDEAHNLVERGREMYSAALYKEDFLELRKQVRNLDGKLARRLGDVNRLFLELKRECETYQILGSVSHIVLKLMNLLTEMERVLEEPLEEEKRENILNLYFQVRAFVNIHDELDENYVIYSEYEENGRFMVRLFCVNPAAKLQHYLENGTGTIFFSATLLPIRYYRSLLSVEKDDYAIYAESPFPRDNLLLIQGNDVTTRYTMRDEGMYRKIADYICTAVSGKKGNYMVFFPSYRFLESVWRVFTDMEPDVDILVQSQNMREHEKEEFLNEFEQERERPLAAFCVMGGAFSEGIDLTDDRLIGAVIVGTGLPQVCTDREIIKGYFESRGMDGFSYAYLYPGMNKVLQSAGRVIRTETDRGLVLLLDSRFSGSRYREIFPREWAGCRVCTAAVLKDYIDSFWK